MQGLMIPLSRSRARRALACLALVMALAALAGCDNGTVSLPTPTPDCAISLRCELTVPPCGPAVTASTFSNGVWDQNFSMPANATSFLGFAPQLPIHIPQSAAWYQVTIIRHVTPQGGPPLLYAGYIHFPLNYKGHFPDTSSILAFEESMGPIGPLTNLSYPDPTFHSGEPTVFVKGSQVIQLATQPAILATIYHLGEVENPSARADELIWTSGPLTMRLMVGITSGLAEYATEPTYPGGNSYASLGGVEEWYYLGDASDPMLEQVAASVAPFTCPE